MPHFISLLVSHENDTANWVFAQQDTSITRLEADRTYDEIRHLPKNLFNGVRASTQPRWIRDNFGIGRIQVITYRGEFNTANTFAALSNIMPVSTMASVMSVTAKPKKRNKKPKQ